MSGRPRLAVAEPDPRWFRARPPRQALVDSGPLIALFNRTDRWHPAVMAWLEGNQHVRLHGTWPVLTEVCALLARRVHNDAALDFLQWAHRGALQIDAPPAGSLDSVLTICRRFASLPLDLADASIAEAAARLGIEHVVTLDRDFDVYRDAKGRRLRNLFRSAGHGSKPTTRE
ncbi:MAG: PIN domain-containing protein [Betaproteobacteria bacterium]|nr:PIN domain-containing protein [Betaproteobacteria bacterium]